MKNRTVSRGIELGMVILLLTGSAISSQVDQKFADSQRRNAQELRQYTWKSRADLQKGGETRYVQLTQMRYDVNGTVQKTLISSTPQQLPARGILGRIAQKMREDVIETLASLETLAKSYGDLPSDKMQRFMAAAIVTPETGQPQKLLRIKGNDVLQPGDSMTVWVDAVTRKVRKVEIQTTLEKKPVKIASDFQDMPQGPTYIARSVIDYPSEELTLIADNFDYERVTP